MQAISSLHDSNEAKHRFPLNFISKMKKNFQPILQDDEIKYCLSGYVFAIYLH